MSLRVAHIIAGLGVGGAERHLVDLLNTMSCEYRAVVCLMPKVPGPSFYGDLDPAIEQFYVRIRRRSLPLGILRLASVLKRSRVDVVHTHMYGSNLYGSMAAKLAGIPVVVTTEHGENPWKKPYHRWLERRVISPLVDLRFCVSPRILEIRRDADGIPASKLRLTVNGTVLPAIESRKPTNSVPVIGAVGRLIPAKDYPGLLTATAVLRRRGFEFQLCIAGDGPEQGLLREMIADLGLENTVQFLGLVSDVDSLYRRIDLCVSSSVREGLPVALLEAMAYGLPVVATDVGASSETVRDGEGGLVVPPSDPKLLADAIARLLDDPELRNELGCSARNRVEQHYSIASVSDFHIKTYRELLARKRAEELQS